MAIEDPVLFRRVFKITGGDFQNAGSVSKEIKKALKQLNTDAEVIWRAMIVSYEAEMNVVLYARECEMTLEISQSGIHLVFDDRGPGIPDVGLAMTEGYSTATREMRERGFGAGLGLPNIKKTSDHLEVVSTVGFGTRLDIRLMFPAAVSKAA
ncbi:MAG: anti-sigma regulatory factor [Candidatus Eisenbacteria bacterium]|jgi:anti-sigma regulatory factor (Ser/Thr protein kinase)|nr:anti-sigma regulatory factor [Candidatus Eisenbacteria bacterium]